MSGKPPFHHLLTPGEVAEMFSVDPKTVARWAADGRLDRIRTPGGHSRFRESDVRALLESDQEKAEQQKAGTVVVELP